MRVAICGIHIESSTFTPYTSSAADFSVRRGAALLARYPFLAPGTPLAGTADWVPLVHARALPGGPVVDADYAAWKKEIVDGLSQAGPLDGVFLDLHGAMSVQGLQDAEGDLVRAVRDAVGPDAVLSAAMDLHGNVSDELFDACDLLTCYRTAPHVDVWETRERAVRNLLEVLASRGPVHRALVHVPLLLPGEKTSTRAEPAASLYARLPQIEARTGILDASIYIGFAWADEPRCKAAVVVSGVDEGAVGDAAMEIGTAMWHARHDFEFVGPARTLADAVTESVTSPRRPFFVSDSGDNPGAGGASDTTAALAAYLAHPEVATGRVSVLVASIVDPGTVARARDLGVGGRGSFELGGHIDSRAPGPVEFSGEVRHFVEAAEGGATAVLRSGGLDVVVTSRRAQYATALMFARVGVPLGRHDVVVVKMGYLEPDLFAAHQGWVIALTAGGVDQHLPRLGHRRIDRPMVPFDADAPAPTTVRTATTARAAAPASAS
ncbi:M81 family metallopeptidase [Occultella kanbiaonis]|uniref:M81 family metallopeptidase n=1 Tax=Occultella kanbiaonis TaxID=2675754 RepID=UPI001A990006|nr:M81 family metallopeptidase [Occultella kanbiaonis]